MTRQPPGAVVQAVRDELAVPGRYHLHSAAPQRPTFFAQLLQWIWAHVTAFLHRLFAHVHVSSQARSAFGIAIVVLCILAFIAIAIHLATRVQLERTRRTRSAPIVESRSAQAYANDAARAAAQGDYARAVRALFIAAVVALDLSGAVNDERGATVNELRRSLSLQHAQLEPPFADIARAYTRAAYAEHPVDREAYERAAQAYGVLERGLHA